MLFIAERHRNARHSVCVSELQNKKSYVALHTYITYVVCAYVIITMELNVENRRKQHKKTRSENIMCRRNYMEAMSNNLKQSNQLNASAREIETKIRRVRESHKRIHTHKLCARKQQQLQPKIQIDHHNNQYRIHSEFFHTFSLCVEIAKFFTQKRRWNGNEVHSRSEMFRSNIATWKQLR